MDEFEEIYAAEMAKYERSLAHGDYDLAIEQLSTAKEAMFISDEIHKEMMKENRSIER